MLTTNTTPSAIDSHVHVDAAPRQAHRGAALAPFANRWAAIVALLGTFAFGAVGAGCTQGVANDAATASVGRTARTRHALTTSAGASSLLAEVNRELGAVQSTSYDHSTYVDESRGVFNFDCSGFVGYALEQSVPEAMPAIRTELGVER